MKYYQVYVDYDGTHSDVYSFYTREEAEKFQKLMLDDEVAVECRITECEKTRYEIDMRGFIEDDNAEKIPFPFKRFNPDDYHGLERGESSLFRLNSGFVEDDAESNDQQ